MSQQIRAKTLETFCEVVAALMKRPRTVYELMEYAAAEQRSITRILDEMKESGLVYRITGMPRSGSSGRLADVWAFQPLPFAYPDHATAQVELDIERTLFEAYASSGGYDLTRMDGDAGKYRAAPTEQAWAGWRAKMVRR